MAIERISLWRNDTFVQHCDNISCADDFAETSSRNVYTVTRNGKAELWGSSFYNKDVIEELWCHTEENGDILKIRLKPGQKSTPVQI